MELPRMPFSRSFCRVVGECGCSPRQGSKLRKAPGAGDQERMRESQRESQDVSGAVTNQSSSEPARGRRT